MGCQAQSPGWPWHRRVHRRGRPRRTSLRPPGQPSHPVSGAASFGSSAWGRQGGVPRGNAVSPQSRRTRGLWSRRTPPVAVGGAAPARARLREVAARVPCPPRSQGGGGRRPGGLEPGTGRKRSQWVFFFLGGVQHCGLKGSHSWTPQVGTVACREVGSVSMVTRQATCLQSCVSGRLAVSCEVFLSLTCEARPWRRCPRRLLQPLRHVRAGLGPGPGACAPHSISRVQARFPL